MLLFVGLMLGLLLSELDQNVFATALPTIVGELSGVDQMLWVTTAYVLTGTLVMPVYGLLGDLLGRKRLFLGALSIFLIGSVVGGLAPDMGWLIVARAVQGLGGGGLLILVQAIVADIIPARDRTLYLSAVGAVFALSAVLGPVLGGWLTETVGWRWIFWLNLPLGAGAIVAAALLLDLPRGRAVRVAVDAWGLGTLCVAVTCLVLLSTWAGTHYSWSSPVVLALVAGAVLAGTGFVVAERRAEMPLIPVRLFADRTFTAATLSSLVMSVAMFGAITYLPTYLQMVQGLTATHSGYLMLTLMAGIALATIGSAQVVSRTGRYRWLPVAGCALAAVALGCMATLTPASGLSLVGGYLFLLGSGIGLALEILVVMVQNSQPASRVGTATAAHSFFREIGVLTGSAVVGTLFTSRLTALLAERIPLPAAEAGPGLDLNALTPAAVHRLPPALRDVVVSAYNDALTPVFGYLVPLMLLSVLALGLVRPVPLATTVADTAAGPDALQGPGPDRDPESEPDRSPEPDRRPEPDGRPQHGRPRHGAESRR